MPPIRPAVTAWLVAATALAAAPGPAVAAAAPAGYHMPDPALVRIVDAPLTPAVSVGPDRRTMLLLARRPMPSIAEIAAPELKLAGLSIDPRTSGPARASSYMGLAVRTLDQGAPRQVTGLGADPRIAHVAWSGDGKHVAFSVTRPDRIELWVLELASLKARRLSTLALNAVLGTPFTWSPDSLSLIVHAVPPERGRAPEAAPEGPAVQEATGQKSPNRTYPNLLKGPHDERLFEYHATSLLARVDLAGRVTRLGAPGLYTGAEPSPDGRYLLVGAIHRPYSYMVPLSRFPRRTEVWSHAAQLVKRVADLPLAESMSVSFDAVRAGRRWIDWRADADATLYWAEAPDGGDPAVDTPVRDRLYTLPAPFGAEPTALVDLGFRVSDVKWGDDGTAIVEEGWWKTRRERTWVVRPNQAPALLFDRSSEDRYGHPGAAIQRRTARNTFVVPVRDGRVLFSGQGASPEGNRPFLDRVSLASGAAERLWRSEAPHYATLTHLLDDEGQRFIVSRESPTEPPNYFLAESGALKQLTHFAHPTPQLAGVKKELLTYRRADGVALSGTLYLPPGYDAGRDGPLPLVMWAYPQEYKDAAAAGQVDRSPYEFNRIWHSSPLVWLTRGYAVLDDPKLPIIGAGATEPNDTYVEQLVAGAKAAVDEVVRRGVADRRRIAIGGHSYGAFMTANLLAHSDLFAAGIARSGAYNRTLTPFGFQSEERTFWEAAGTYHKMSPFENAHRIHEPLLLIHGAADSNPGTFPMQSERLYQALKGLGGRARLVMLPHEEHGYRARESVLHMLYESERWLDEHVKHRPAEPRP